MNRLYRRIFVGSLFFYIMVITFIRYIDCPEFTDPSLITLYSLPLEFMSGQESVKLQTCVLSASQVAEYLRNNPEDCSNFVQDGNQPEYVVIKYQGRRHFGDLKVYFSCFPHPIIIHISLVNSMGTPCNLILPLPFHSEKEPCKVSIRWKNFW